MIGSGRTFYLNEISEKLNDLNETGLEKLYPFLLALLSFKELRQPAARQVESPYPEYLKVVK